MLKKFLVVLALVSILTIPVVVFAEDYGLGAAAPQDLKTSKLGTDIPSIVGNVVGVGLSLLGVIFFLLILYAGILWMTALGNEKKVDTAKNIMEAAGIGLMIVLGAYAITTFLFKNVAGTTGTGSNTGSNPPAGNDTAGCCTFPGVSGVNVASKTDCGGSGVFALGACPTSGGAQSCNYDCVTPAGCVADRLVPEEVCQVQGYVCCRP